jgi:hypothetical protein
MGELKKCPKCGGWVTELEYGEPPRCLMCGWDSDPRIGENNALLKNPTSGKPLAPAKEIGPSELARTLGISRQAAWERLRKQRRMIGVPRTDK